MPQNPSGSGIQCESIVGGSDVHDAADDHGSRFEHLGVAGMENPRRAELMDIRGIDFVQAAVTAPRVVAVIGCPIVAHGLRQQIFATHIGGSTDRRLSFLSGSGQCDYEGDWGQNEQKKCFAFQFHFNGSPTPTWTSWSKPRST